VTKYKVAAYMIMVSVFLVCLVAVPQSVVGAEDEHGGDEAAAPEDFSMAGAVVMSAKALSAALSLAVAALATAKVQAAVGAGATGALAEKPETFGSLLLLYAIPETMVLLGFVMGFMLIRM
jgi:V/A-type H+-transporting ATPase subunit K